LLPNSRSTFMETVAVADTTKNIQSSRKASGLCSGDAALKSRQKKQTIKKTTPESFHIFSNSLFIVILTSHGIQSVLL